MSTTVSHKGTGPNARSVKDLPIENWLKHKDVIIAYCDGADVENRHGDRNWHGPIITPEWYPDHEYRIAQRKPAHGEVWEYTTDGKPFLVVNFLGSFGDFVSLCGNESANKFALQAGELVYAAPSVEAYYAGLFYDKSLSKDSGFEYDDASKLLSIVKEAMK